MQKQLRTAGLLLLLFAALRSEACWDQAARRYNVSAQLLHAIARVESRLRPNAVNTSHHARTGSYDIGLMQINSSHLHSLARYGIRERDLYDPCTNIHVGAWLLADSVARYGATWDAVGAYNAACTRLKGPACRQARAKYARRVYEQLWPSDATPRPLATADTRSPIAQEARQVILSARVSR